MTAVQGDGASMEPGHACVVCAQTWPSRDALERHWRETDHDPRIGRVQAIDRARASISPTARPPMTTAEQRRRAYGDES